MRNQDYLWCPTTWGAVTFPTFALVIVGGVQTVVFGVQARKLAETIDTVRAISRDQSNDVRDSIAQATRAAIAMEGMAAGMVKSTEITTEIGRTQREFGQMQMRAYLAVYYGTVVPQDSAIGWHTEVRLQLVNNGHTPAHEVSYQANAAGNCSPPFVQSFLDTVTAGSIHDGAWTEQPLSPFPAMT